MMSDGKRPGAVSAFRVPMLLLLLAAAPSAGLAQSNPPPGLPPGVYMGEADYKQATAGTYALDPDHASVIARVSHLGYSYSIFRFDRLSASLTWDPANTVGASLSAKVETASITSNVKDFAQELSGNKFLNSPAFPEATFVSSAFRQMSTRRGKVEGQFTLMGKTKPVTFDVELVGAGKGFADCPRIGVSARGTINPADFGLPPLFGDSIEIVVDVEFQKDS
jgi:polyisoprenoid-binding protein YceI